MVCKTVIRGFDSHLRLSHFQPQALVNKGFGAFFLVWREKWEMRRNAPDCGQNGQQKGDKWKPYGVNLETEMEPQP